MYQVKGTGCALRRADARKVICRIKFFDELADGQKRSKAPRYRSAPDGKGLDCVSARLLRADHRLNGKEPFNANGYLRLATRAF